MKLGERAQEEGIENLGLPPKAVAVNLLRY
jgi:hypothetical protein